MKIEFRLLWQINCSLRYESAGSTQGSWDDGAWELGRAVCTAGRCGHCPKDAEPACIGVRAGWRMSPREHTGRGMISFIFINQHLALTCI